MVRVLRRVLTTRGRSCHHQALEAPPAFPTAPSFLQAAFPKPPAWDRTLGEVLYPVQPAAPGCLVRRGAPCHGQEK